MTTTMTTAAAALARLADIDLDLDAVVSLNDSGDETAEHAAAMLAAKMSAIGFGDLGTDLDDPQWHDVAAAARDLYERIADLAGVEAEPDNDNDEPAGDGDAAAKSRPLAAHKRRRIDPAPVILDAFYGGLYHAGRAVWWTVKTAVKLSIAAGKLAAPYVAAGARATARAIGSGMVHVGDYMRGGTQVSGYDRAAAPAKQAPMGRQQRAFLFKADSIADDGTFEGYGSLFGELDDGGDVVEVGAFVDSLAAHKAAGTMPKLLEQHDPAKPLGIWLDMYEDKKGLRCKGKLLLEVARAREVHALMKAGAIDGLSIGYETIEYSHVSLDEFSQKYSWYGSSCAASSSPTVRLLSKCDLWEVSIVTFPMLRTARVDAVKAAHAGLDIDRLAAAVARRSAAIAALAT